MLSGGTFPPKDQEQDKDVCYLSPGNSEPERTAQPVKKKEKTGHPHCNELQKKKNQQVNLACLKDLRSVHKTKTEQKYTGKSVAKEKTPCHIALPWLL